MKALGEADAVVVSLKICSAPADKAVSKALAAETLEELSPGAPMLRTLGQPRGDLMMALKSGNLGGVDFSPDTLSQLI